MLVDIKYVFIRSSLKWFGLVLSASALLALFLLCTPAKSNKYAKNVRNIGSRMPRTLLYLTSDSCANLSAAAVSVYNMTRSHCAGLGKS
jgi:membrane-anchored protein YejM (alkaline phosphatase superfamily)